MSMSERLKGKVALVFGAGSIGPGWGNGKATAVAFAEEGASVIAVDLRAEAAKETARIIGERGKPCLAPAADVTDTGQVAVVVERVRQEFGLIDILHNNVGFPESGGPVELPEEIWDRAMDSNLKTVFLACKHVLPVMEAQGEGAIVNISSLAGHRWSGYDNVSYSAAKAGVNQLTQAVAMQYAARGIRVNAIPPGLYGHAPHLHQDQGPSCQCREHGARAQRPGSDGPDGHRLGRRPCRRLPRLGRSPLHNRRPAVG
jgi:NAD(P)-dependent dehydrogenase (short-subunit alcohol dehydrogenase family)